MHRRRRIRPHGGSDMGVFDGKSIFITGGGAGLGRECALQWGAEGARVVVSDIVGKRAEDVAADIVKAGGEAVSAAVDVTKESEVEEGIRLAVSTFGRLDIAFANAGKAPIGFGATPLEDVTEEDW